MVLGTISLILQNNKSGMQPEPVMASTPSQLSLFVQEYVRVQGKREKINAYDKEAI